MLLPDIVMGACVDDRLCWLGATALGVMVLGGGALLFWPSRRRAPSRQDAKPPRVFMNGRRASDRPVRWTVLIISVAFWIGAALWLWWLRQ